MLLKIINSPLGRPTIYLIQRARAECLECIISLPFLFYKTSSLSTKELFLGNQRGLDRIGRFKEEERKAHHHCCKAPVLTRCRTAYSSAPAFYGAPSAQQSQTCGGYNSFSCVTTASGENPMDTDSGFVSIYQFNIRFSIIGPDALFAFRKGKSHTMQTSCSIIR